MVASNKLRAIQSTAISSENLPRAKPLPRTRDRRNSPRRQVTGEFRRDDGWNRPRVRFETADREAKSVADARRMIEIRRASWRNLAGGAS